MSGLIDIETRQGNYDFLFAKPAIICEISKKICKNYGRCTDCPTGYYVMFFDDEKILRIFEEDKN